MPSGCRSFRHLRLFLLHAVPALPVEKWWKVRVERVGIPMLTAIPLLTLPQFIMLQYVNGKAENWHTLSGYDKFNTTAWGLFPTCGFTGAGGADLAGRGAV